MKRKSKTIQIFLTCGLFLAITLAGMLGTAAAQAPRIHVLLVWGTKAADTSASVEAASKRIEDGLRKIGIYNGSSSVASFTVLSGDDAHPRQILDHCYRMAQQAGSNDALFVYILCHGCTDYLVGEPVHKTENLIHLLGPVSLSAANMLEDRATVIKRYSILRAMSSRNHRLNVLITDACSRIEELQVEPLPVSMAGQPKLLYILQTERGTINWNSSCPIGGDDEQGELAIGLGKPDGTVFTTAFLNIASQVKSSKRNYTKEDFFKELGTELVESFNDYADQTRGKPGYRFFMQQEQQTLTEFDDYGRVKRRWTENDRVE